MLKPVDESPNQCIAKRKRKDQELNHIKRSAFRFRFTLLLYQCVRVLMMRALLFLVSLPMMR